ncbi:MAG: hypothetical protein Q9166_005487 [cf. Caloplaca sp. 2 TL-2023]
MPSSQAKRVVCLAPNCNRSFAHLSGVISHLESNSCSSGFKYRDLYDLLSHSPGCDAFLVTNQPLTGGPESYWPRGIKPFHCPGCAVAFSSLCGVYGHVEHQTCNIRISGEIMTELTMVLIKEIGKWDKQSKESEAVIEGTEQNVGFSGVSNRISDTSGLSTKKPLEISRGEVVVKSRRDISDNTVQSSLMTNPTSNPHQVPRKSTKLQAQIHCFTQHRYLCPGIFTSYSGLLAHLESNNCRSGITAGDLENFVAQCPNAKGFVVPGKEKRLVLGRHQRDEVDDEDYSVDTQKWECPHCPHAITKRRTLAKHLRNRMCWKEIAPYKPFKCPECGSEWERLIALVAHAESDRCKARVDRGVLADLMVYLEEEIGKWQGTKVGTWTRVEESRDQETAKAKPDRSAAAVGGHQHTQDSRSDESKGSHTPEKSLNGIETSLDASNHQTKADTDTLAMPLSQDRPISGNQRDPDALSAEKHQTKADPHALQKPKPPNRPISIIERDVNASHDHTSTDTDVLHKHTSPANGGEEIVGTTYSSPARQNRFHRGYVDERSPSRVQNWSYGADDEYLSTDDEEGGVAL